MEIVFYANACIFKAERNARLNTDGVRTYFDWMLTNIEY